MASHSLISNWNGIFCRVGRDDLVLDMATTLMVLMALKLLHGINQIMIFTFQSSIGFRHPRTS